MAKKSQKKQRTKCNSSSPDHDKYNFIDNRQSDYLSLFGYIDNSEPNKEDLLDLHPSTTRSTRSKTKPILVQEIKQELKWELRF